MVAPHRLEKLFSPLVIVGSASFVAGIAAAYVSVAFFHQFHAEYVTVARQSVSQSIEAPGTLRPTESVTLGFSRAGTLSRVLVAVGERVTTRELIASLSSANLTAQINATKTLLNSENTKLTQLKAGDIDAETVELRVAVRQKILSSYQAAEGAAEAGRFIRPDASPPIAISISNPDLVKSIVTEKTHITELLESWKTALPAAEGTTTATALAVQATAAADHLTEVEIYLNHVATLLTYAVPSIGYSATDIDALRQDVLQARLSVADSLTALTSAAGKLSIAEAVGPQAITVGQASLASTTARLRTLESQLQDTRLLAPIAGIIREVRAGPGDAVRANQPVFILSSDAHVEMAASVVPADAAHIHLGDNAVVTLPSGSYAAQVVAVTPGASNYTVIAQIIDTNAAVSPKSSGTLSVMIGSSTDALIVPQNALITKEGQTYVLRSGLGGRDDLIPVVTGLTSGGKVEIVSGLSEGDKIRSSINVY